MCCRAGPVAAQRDQGAARRSVVPHGVGRLLDRRGARRLRPAARRARGGLPPARAAPARERRTAHGRPRRAPALARLFAQRAGGNGGRILNPRRDLRRVSAEAERPVRIEFFGDAVESLREFDPATQRSTGISKNARCCLWKRRRALPELLAALSADAAPFPGWEFHAPKVRPRPHSLESLLDSPVVVWDEPEPLITAAERLWQRLTATTEAPLPPEQLFFRWGELLAAHTGASGNRVARTDAVRRAALRRHAGRDPVAPARAVPQFDARRRGRCAHVRRTGLPGGVLRGHAGRRGPSERHLRRIRTAAPAAHRRRLGMAPKASCGAGRCCPKRAWR
jgi:hypothetical protein